MWNHEGMWRDKMLDLIDMLLPADNEYTNRLKDILQEIQDKRWTWIIKDVYLGYKCKKLKMEHTLIH